MGLLIRGVTCIYNQTVGGVDLMLLRRKQNTVELKIATSGKSQFSKPSKHYSRYSGGFFSCVIDATNTRLMVIIRSELDHSLFLSSIETQKKGYEGKLCLKHLCFFRRWHFFTFFYLISSIFIFFSIFIYKH